MDTAQWALLISLTSAAIAGCSLGWNIYRDIVLKPRLRVTVSVISVVTESGMAPDQNIMIKATNFGPGKIKLQSIRMRHSWWSRTVLRRRTHAFVIHDYKNPMSAKLPVSLDVGEEANYIFPFSAKCNFLGNEFTQIGLQDSFGRSHWAASGEVADARARWAKAFGSKHQ